MVWKKPIPTSLEILLVLEYQRLFLTCWAFVYFLSKGNHIKIINIRHRKWYYTKGGGGIWNKISLAWLVVLFQIEWTNEWTNGMNEWWNGMKERLDERWEIGFHVEIHHTVCLFIHSVRSSMLKSIIVNLPSHDAHCRPQNCALTWYFQYGL